MNQFRRKISKIKGSTFRMSGKSTDSRRRPMPACSLLSFKQSRLSFAIFGRDSGQTFEKIYKKICTYGRFWFGSLLMLFTAVLQLCSCTQKTNPSTQKTNPSTQKTNPDTQKTIPDTQKTIPDTRDTIPRTQLTIPTTQLRISGTRPQQLL